MSLYDKIEKKVWKQCAGAEINKMWNKSYVLWKEGLISSGERDPAQRDSAWRTHLGLAQKSSDHQHPLWQQAWIGAIQ